eukprot:6941748-Prymnesium_polylepis.1
MNQSQGCIDTSTGGRDAATTVRLLQKLEALKGGAGTDYMRGIRLQYHPHREARPSGSIDFLAMPIVFHKLMAAREAIDSDSSQDPDMPSYPRIY